MQKEQFNTIISDIHHLQATDIRDLQQLTERHPYFQLPYILIAKKLHMEHKPAFEQALKTAATFTYSREALFQLIERTPLLSSEIPEQKEREGNDPAHDEKPDAEIAVIKEQAFQKSTIEHIHETEEIPISEEELLKTESSEPDVTGGLIPLQVAEVIQETPEEIAEDVNAIQISEPETVNEIRSEAPEVIPEPLIEDEQLIPDTETTEEKEIEHALQELLQHDPFTDDETNISSDSKEEIPVQHDPEPVLSPILPVVPSEEELPIFEFNLYELQMLQAAKDLPLEDLVKEIRGDHGNTVKTSPDLSGAYSFSGWLHLFSGKQGNRQVKLREEQRPIRIESNIYALYKREFDEEDASALASKSVRMHDNLITETYATILAGQGKTQKAIQMFGKLSLKYPQKSLYFAAKIEALKNK